MPRNRKPARIGRVWGNAARKARTGLAEQSIFFIISIGTFLNLNRSLGCAGRQNKSYIIRKKVRKNTCGTSHKEEAPSPGKRGEARNILYRQRVRLRAQIKERRERRTARSRSDRQRNSRYPSPRLPARQTKPALLLYSRSYRHRSAGAFCEC